MASLTKPLTLEEFRERYAAEPGYEYWFGEVVRKAVPTWPHVLLVAILIEAFTKAGYRSGPELELRVDPTWEPRPDVAAALSVEGPYPTQPVDIVAEVLSPDDRMMAVFEKCGHYARIGIPQIFVFDPEAHKAWQWSRETQNLERISTLSLLKTTIAVQTLWHELDKRLA